MSSMLEWSYWLSVAAQQITLRLRDLKQQTFTIHGFCESGIWAQFSWTLLPQNFSRDCSQAIGKEVSSTGSALVQKGHIWAHQHGCWKVSVPHHVVLYTGLPHDTAAGFLQGTRSKKEQQQERKYPRKKAQSLYNLISEGDPITPDIFSSFYSRGQQIQSILKGRSYIEHEDQEAEFTDNHPRECLLHCLTLPILLFLLFSK